MSRLALALKEKLGEKPDFKVVAMPDFFLDYILAFPGKLDQMTGAMVDVAGRGGGNLLGWKHLIGRGGEASHFLSPPSKTSVFVVPLIETAELGGIAPAPFLKDVGPSPFITTRSRS